MYILNEDLFDDLANITQQTQVEPAIPAVETEVVTDAEIAPEGPQEGADVGIANIIHDLIIDENEAIQGYNNAIANLESRPELKPILQDIANEEMNHIGMLEVALELLSPNAADIEEGKVEAEGELNDNSETAPVLEESLYIPDDLKLLNIIDNALMNTEVSDKLTKAEIKELANSVNEFLHKESEKKPRNRR